ncbi:MAG: hypothetical protein M1817_005409 [Caeruleum heppii]|nr:MAG: hypothetical protein M1817_005409 [Caeruleum heppii]
MSFGRSSSGPGGLSINTGSANSLFGANKANPNQTPSGLFGSQPTNSQAQQSTGGLFGSSNNMAANSQSQSLGGGLFGAQAQTTGQTTGGLFGASSQQAQPQQSGGLFGSLNTSSLPQQGGGLFGSTSQQTQPGGLFGATSQQSQPQQSGGLFGGLGQGQGQQQSGGLFGATNQSSQPQQGGGLFGGAMSQNQQSQPQQSGGLFGNLGQGQNTQPQPQQTGGLFGSSTTQNKLNTFGSQSTQQQPQNQQRSFGTSLGQNASQPNTVPGVRIDLSQCRPTTRFTDLHEDIQAQIKRYDDMILTQMDRYKQCASFMPQHSETLKFLPNDVDYISQRLRTVNEALENDAQAIAKLRDTVKRDEGDATLSFQAIDNLRLPLQYHHAGHYHASQSKPNSSVDRLLTGASDEPGSAKDLIGFFSSHVDAMERGLSNFSSSVAQIEGHLRGVEAHTAQQIQTLMMTRGTNGADKTADDQVRELAAVLRDFENAILGVAGKVGGAREGVQELVLGPAEDVGGGRRYGR